MPSTPTRIAPAGTMARSSTRASWREGVRHAVEADVLVLHPLVEKGSVGASRPACARRGLP